MTYAKIIADSISEQGHRLTTMEVRMHRFVLAEFNTHRAFSRNSASSRAIPFKKQVERVMEDPAIPASWPAEQKGMQGGEELPDGDGINSRGAAERVWRRARKDAVQHAFQLDAMGVHKSVVNRLLEPFMWHTVVVSSTEWDNFWRQRCSPLAQPEIRVAAEAMRDAYDNSEPEEIEHGKWHMPYLWAADYEWARNADDDDDDDGHALLRMISVARCARVSYLTHDGMRDPTKDIELYQRLVTADPPHASPLEHVATPCIGHPTPPSGIRLKGIDPPAHQGNFIGWDQLRHEVLP